MTEILIMWTETDAEARRAAIESHFEDDVQFFDADGQFVGFEGIESFSDSLQSRFPDARFALVRPPQMIGGAIRAYSRLPRRQHVRSAALPVEVIRLKD